MRPSGLTTMARASGVAAALLGSLAASTLVTGCGGGGGGGSDPQYGAKALAVVDIDLDQRDGVSLNQPLTIEFSDFVLPTTIRPDTVQIRLGPRYGIQSFGEFKVQGNLVTFYPRLPTKADLSDSGFQPDSQYRVTVVGYPKVNHVAAYTGRPLTRTSVGSFATAADTDPDVFTVDTYKDFPPIPTVRFTNPSDVIPQSPWTTAGGAVNVPTDATIAIVFYRVPLLPSTVTSSNVTLTMIERFGAALVPPRPIQGTPILVQSFDSVSINYVPTFPLADQARYVLRMENRISDLTGNYDLADNAKRTALRTLADGGTDPLLNAFVNGTGAWAGLPHPEEVDPRTFLIFTTRDEPIKDTTYYLNFDGSDRDQNGGNGLDPNNTTASFNIAVPGAVAATFTAAGGTGVLGDFIPVANTTLNTNASTIVNGIFNFRQITINANITVTVSGTLPITLNSLRDVTVSGILGATGGVGDQAEQNYQTSSMPLANGGAGNAGGGKGGANAYATYTLPNRGDTGDPGPNGGGGGGQGGQQPNSTVYRFGGGGGGGSHQYAGNTGGNGSYPSYSTWNGTGGVGGATGGIQPSSPATENGNLFYSKGVGGGGGGAGGNSGYTPQGWNNGGAGGGGGGGGILVKSAGNIRVDGRIIAKGGVGGSSGNYYYYGGAGGGGGGGAIALYANDTLDIRNSTLDTSGGAGGAPYSYGWGGAGGKGGGGYVQLEALNTTTKIVGATGAGAASILPDYYTAAFNPIGSSSDAPSLFTSTWFNMGVFDPILQAAASADFTDQNFADCTITYEIQMAREDPTNFGKADTSSISVSTGNSSNAVRASNWVTLNSSTSGAQDVTSSTDFTGMNGHSYQFYRVRITFTLADGQTRTSPVPYVDRMRLRVKY